MPDRPALIALGAVGVLFAAGAVATLLIAVGLDAAAFAAVREISSRLSGDYPSTDPQLLTAQTSRIWAVRLPLVATALATAALVAGIAVLGLLATRRQPTSSPSTSRFSASSISRSAGMRTDRT